MEVEISLKQFRLLTVLIFVTLLASVSIVVVVLSNSSQNLPVANSNNPTPLPCKPAFADGDGPYYKENAPLRTNLAPANTQGKKLVVSGRLFYSDCVTPVANAEIDLWQADETGVYKDDFYRGRIKTNNLGDYKFETIVPKGYGEGTGYRPPHIHFKVRINGNLAVTSEIFFPDVKGKPGFDDAYIMNYEEITEDGKTIANGSHNIYLPIKQ